MNERAQRRYFGWFADARAAFGDLLRYAPFGNWVAVPLFAIAALAFVASAIGTFWPAQAHWSTALVLAVGALPGPSVAVICLALMLGPLTFLTYWLDRYTFKIALYGLTILRLRRPPVFSIFFLIVAVTPWLVPLHGVRIVEPQDAKIAISDRVTLAQAFRTWERVCAPNVAKGQPLRPIIVAISGGASRAGLWGARVLRAVDGMASEGQTSIFAISSVSGGSLGAAAYLSTLAGQNDSRCLLDRLDGDAHRLGDRDAAMRDAIGRDALGPILAGFLMGDVSRSLLGLPAAAVRWITVPERSQTDTALRGGDRAEALERAFEINWDKGRSIISAAKSGSPVPFGAPYLSLFYASSSGHGLRGNIPLWIANGTDDQNGDRVITAPFRIGSTLFPAARDALALLQADVPISTAIDNTARFPYLSPAGEMDPVSGVAGVEPTQIVDGGYFENEGLQTALELARRLTTFGNAAQKVEPIIVQATADADADVRDQQIVRCWHVFQDHPDRSQGSQRPFELMAPLEGVYMARGGHSHVALREARKEFCAPHDPSFFHFYLYRKDTEDIPLNWVLSPHIAQYIWFDAIGNVANLQELWRLKKALATGRKS